jgi:Uma2 family endonuclease
MPLNPQVWGLSSLSPRIGGRGARIIIHYSLFIIHYSLYFMIQTIEKRLTLDAFLQLPETKPTKEYIEGEIIEKPRPQSKHSRIQLKLGMLIENIASKDKIASAFTELRCTFNERSLVPDLSILKWENIPLDSEGELINKITIPPDWVIEILSPEQNILKVTKNILFCLKSGTQLGWLIDPEDKSILVYYPDKATDYFENNNEQLPVPQFLPELKLTVGEIFAWLKY